MKRNSSHALCTWYLHGWMGLTAGAVLAAALVTSQPSVSAAQNKAKSKSATATEKGAKEGTAASAPKAAPWPYLHLDREDALSRLRSVTIKSMLRGSEQITPTFDDFFVKWFFPQFTEQRNLNKLPELRAELQAYFDKARRNPNSTERLNQLTLDVMFAVAIGAREAVSRDGKNTAIVIRRLGGDGKRNIYHTLSHKTIPAIKVKGTRPARRDFHPAVKYNAMLLIAGLNEKPESRDEAAVPWLKALEPLVQVATYPRAPQSLRVAALIGIARHVAVKDTGIKEYIASRMEKIIKEKEESPSDRSPDGVAWIKRQAIEILADLGLPGPEGKFLTTLGAVVADGSQPLALRSAAAQAISKIRPETLPAKEANPLTRELSSLLLDACRYEINGGGSGDEPVSWPRLAVSLDGVNNALAVVEAFNGDEEKALSAQLKNAISSLSSAVGRANTSHEKQKQALTQQTAAIERMMGAPGTIEDAALPPTDGPTPPPIEPPPDFQF
ncbi:MAG: hypothetical protein OES79_05270 [Planctomycetota bacterium]|nr:hypothetical protein [Planctomycetota bacterium]